MKFDELYAKEWDAFLKEILENIVAFAAQAHNRETIIQKLKRSQYTDDQIKLGLECYEQKYGISSGGAVLRGKTAKDRLNWYSPVTDPDPNSRWGKLRKVLQGKGWADDHIDDLDSQSNTVVSNLASPKKVEPSAIKGLVLGYVQSGKTANFSAVIAKATDEGYRLVIVLSGIHNGLRSQTEKRLRAELTDPFGGSNSFNLTTSDPSGDFKAENSVTPNALFDVSGKFTLAVLKKNTSVLNKFTKWISTATPDVLRQCPVLIIDDEADQAGVNEGKGPETRTAINRRIVELIEFLKLHTTVSYCGYTATPFANVLIDANDEADLFPRDFIVSLNAPDSYVGPERLFGRASVDEDGGSSGLNLVRHIDIAEAIDTDDAKLAKDIKPSLKNAIQSFLLAGAERIRRGHQDKHITMLVHTSHLTSVHSEMCEKIDSYLKQLRVFVEENETEVMHQFEELWDKDFRKTTARDFTRQDMGTFESIVDCLKVFVDKVTIIEENNKSETRLNFDPDKVWAIIVGGNTLSRGLTIEGLTISYFHRTASGYDTLLQMGRWFGYRNGYLDLTRIYVTPEMEANFYHLATVEHELREDIYRMEQNGETPFDIALKIRDHDDLEITGKRVLKKNGVFASNTYSASKIQASHIFVDDVKTADENFKAIKSLLSNLEEKKLKIANEFDRYRRCHVYRGADPKTILKFLEEYNFSKADKKFNFGLLYSYISNLAENGELTDWSVALMSANQTDERKLVDMETNGIKAYAVERRQSDQVSRTPKELGTVVRYITVLRDELIDMGDVIPTDEMNSFLKDEKMSKSITQRRNLRPPTRGLVLIYPLYTHWQLSQIERDKLREGMKFHPLTSDIHKLFGITLVFPPTRLQHFDVNYIANASVLGNKTKGKPAA